GHPIGRDRRQHFVDLEHAARPDAEVGDLLVAAHEVDLERRAVVREGVEPEVRRAVGGHRHQAAELLRADEPLDLLGRDVRVDVVEDHAGRPRVALPRASKDSRCRPYALRSTPTSMRPSENCAGLSTSRARRISPAQVPKIGRPWAWNFSSAGTNPHSCMSLSSVVLSPPGMMRPSTSASCSGLRTSPAWMPHLPSALAWRSKSPCSARTPIFTARLAPAAVARLAGSDDLKMPEPTNTASAPSCIISAASAGVAMPPAEKFGTGSLPAWATQRTRSYGAPRVFASVMSSS